MGICLAPKDKQISFDADDIEAKVYHRVRLKLFLSFHEGFSSGLDKIGIEAKLQGKRLLFLISVKCSILGEVHPYLL